MDNLSERNDFIRLFEELYDAIYMYPVNMPEKKSTEVVENPSKKTSWFRKFVKNSKDTVNETTVNETVHFSTHEDKIKEAYDNLRRYMDNILSKESQDFWTLWRFCQFIRWAEKIMIYKNDPDDSLIFVDSEMNADMREFKFNSHDSKLYFKLQLISRPELNTFISPETSQYVEAITILIERNYGKKMKTKIVSVDREVELQDDSDIYLINQINKSLNDFIRLTVIHILDPLMGRYYDITMGNQISYGFYFNKEG